MESTTRQNCLIVNTRMSTTTNWLAAADDIWRLLVEVGVRAEEYTVEIMNCWKLYADTSSCLDDDDELLAYIEEVQRDVEEFVARELREYTSIAYHLRIPRYDRDAPGKPTLVIFVPPGTKADYQRITEGAIRILDRPKYAHLVLHVEILVGKVSLGTPAQLKGVFQRGVVDGRPKNGASIGVEGVQRNSGSLGGWVTLTHPDGRVFQCGMTCCQFLTNSDPGVTLDRQIVWPSDFDAGHSRQVCIEQLEAGNRNPHAYCEILSGLVDSREVEGIGQVLFTSGVTRTEMDDETKKPHIIDWALFLTPDTFRTNKPPAQGFGFQDLPDDVYYNLQDTDRVTTTGKLSKGMWVGRAGRTSTRQGSVNLVQRKVKWETGLESYETEVLSIGVGQDFAEEGDAGSWVVNQDKQLVGMCVAVDEGCSDNGAMITPIDVLVRDIEDRTGFRVSLPEEE